MAHERKFAELRNTDDVESPSETGLFQNRDSERDFADIIKSRKRDLRQADKFRTAFTI